LKDEDNVFYGNVGLFNPKK